MNVVLPMIYKNITYLVEYNEPDSTHDAKEYTVRIESIKYRGYQNIEMEELIGKEFTFRTSDLNENKVPLLDGDKHHILELIIKSYRDHIVKDVNCLQRV